MAPLEALQLMYAEEPSEEIAEAIEIIRSVAAALNSESEGEDPYMNNLATKLRGNAK